MKYPGNSTITFAPQQPPPPGNPYQGTTNETGDVLTIDGEPYVYDPAWGYKRQEPGDPPGDWKWITPFPFGVYVAAEADAAFMVYRSVEAGTAAVVT